MKVIRYITLVLNIAAILALWACCLSTMVHPMYYPYVGVVGLAFPAVLAVNVLFLIPWLFLRKRLLLLPLVGMGVVSGFILDYCPMNRRVSAPEGADVVKVVTWNCHGFGWSPNSTNHDSLSAEFTRYVKDADADIISLQEAAGENQWFAERFIKEMKAEGYVTSYVGGRALVTRYEVVDTMRVKFDTRGCNGAAVFTLFDGKDTLVVVNTHFESDQFSPDEMEDYAQAIRNPDEVSFRALGETFVERLGSASKVRAAQVDSVVAYLDRLDSRRIIVCGDFNDTPISYAYKQLDRRLNNVFRKAGRGIGLSYSKRKFPVRIDHIFASDDWVPYGAFVDKRVTVSDHFPVVVWLEKRQK